MKSYDIGGIPLKYRQLVGTKQMLGGGLFSGKRAEPYAEYNVVDIRWGNGQRFDWQEFEEKGPDDTTYHPTYELLVKNQEMKRSRWTRGFSIPEISIIKGKVVKQSKHETAN